jgi:hypothetical protein
VSVSRQRWKARNHIKSIRNSDVNDFFVLFQKLIIAKGASHKQEVSQR